MKAPGWIKDSVEPLLGTGDGRRILAVEGSDDVAVYAKWLEKIALPGVPWSGRLELVDAGSKPALLRGLRWLRQAGGDPAEVHGLVDRDQWDANTIRNLRRELPRLYVCERRHCLESYFCDPAELESALRNKNAAAYGAHCDQLRRDVQAERVAWVKHWALWVTLQRVAQRLSGDGQFPSFFHGEHPLPSDNTIKQRLREWDRIVNPKNIFSEFDKLRASSLRRHAPRAGAGTPVPGQVSPGDAHRSGQRRLSRARRDLPPDFGAARRRYVLECLSYCWFARSSVRAAFAVD